MAGFCVAYAIGLGALLVWPDREAAPQWTVLGPAGIIVLASAALIDWLAFRRPPHIGWSLRRWRYAIPAIFGWIIATVWLSVERDANPDWALPVYVVALPVLAASVFVADLWWASDSRRTSTDINPS
jgi:hypothetical protein